MERNFNKDFLIYLANRFSDRISLEDILVLLHAGSRIYRPGIGISYYQAMQTYGVNDYDRVPLQMSYNEHFISYDKNGLAIWECIITMFGENYIGVGSNKKLAKRNAWKLVSEWYDE